MTTQSLTARAAPPLRAATSGHALRWAVSLAAGALLALLFAWDRTAAALVGAAVTLVATLLWSGRHSTSWHAGATPWAAILRLRRAPVAPHIGPYPVRRRLGAGGMGEVFEAWDPRLRRVVAIKRAYGRGSHPARLLHEAQLTAQLTSAHTLRVLDVGATEDGASYFVMERLAGSDLEALVQEDGPVDPQRVRQIVRQAADALAETHALGLLHGDVKPANLFLGPRGTDRDHVTLLDFGVARPAHEPCPVPPTTKDVARGVEGTPAYLAPEVLSGEDDVDGRADVYALGCVAYWLLTGRRVFEKRNALQLVLAHAIEPPAPPSRFVDVPKDLEALVLRCLAKTPAERPTAAALREQLTDSES